MNISLQTLAEIEKEMNVLLEEMRLLNQEVDIKTNLTNQEIQKLTEVPNDTA